MFIMVEYACVRKRQYIALYGNCSKPPWHISAYENLFKQHKTRREKENIYIT
jgi:hypothetical protein